MLIKFEVENWMSYRDRAVFSMLATRERQHSERVARVSTQNLKLLPVAAIYGGNASGKSNLHKAMRYSRDYILHSREVNEDTRVSPFRLNHRNKIAPAFFAYTILIDKDIFEYSFSVDSLRIIEEKLVQIKNTSQKIIFHRLKDELRHIQVMDVDKEQVGLVFKTTRPNQLFLSNAVNNNMQTVKPIYDWFYRTLVLIAPDAPYRHYFDFYSHLNPSFNHTNMLIATLDLGIDQVAAKPSNMPYEAVKPFLDALKKEHKPGDFIHLPDFIGLGRKCVAQQGDEYKLMELRTVHLDADGQIVSFTIDDESDGTKRTLELLPAFVNLSKPDSISRVYFMDEIDRSLHTLLSRQLLTYYLQGLNASSRFQLLFTTHDVMLMDQSMLRRDEMWITERESLGNTTLNSFSEFKDVRYDKDIRKSYLQGRMGGVPRFLSDKLISAFDIKSNKDISENGE